MSRVVAGEDGGFGVVGFGDFGDGVEACVACALAAGAVRAVGVVECGRHYGVCGVEGWDGFAAAGCVDDFVVPGHVVEIGEGGALV